MTEAEFVRRFTYHAPTEEQTEKIKRMRAAGLEMARLIVEIAPPCTERALALTYVDMMVMSVNAAIVRGPQAPLLKGPVETTKL